MKLSGQSEFNNWIFGNRAGVTFSPSLISTGPHSIVTLEGVASISDASGNLLFYTDGVTVWNRLGMIMLNGTGLLGNASTTQSAVILQMIGQPNRYYIFTAPESSTVNPIAYSTVDMTLDGGLGGVVLKNLPLFTPSTEKITVVRHCNNVDAWLITHDRGTNIFRVWPITASGIGLPVTSAVGTTVNTGSNGSIGYMKASTQGHKLSICHYGQNIAQVLDFDNQTGIVSNALTTSTLTGPYGTEFSPNGRYVYYTYNNGAQLRRYDLCNNSSTNIVTNMGNFWGAMQIGPTGRIYVSQRGRTFLSSIPNPDAVGATFIYNDIPYVVGTNGNFGLPNFAQFYQRVYDPFISYQVTCNQVQFLNPVPTNTCAYSPNATYLWNFGDGNSSTASDPVHVYSSPGTFNVSLQLTFACYTETLTTVVAISNVSNFPINTNQ